MTQSTNIAATLAAFVMALFSLNSIHATEKENVYENFNGCGENNNQPPQPSPSADQQRLNTLHQYQHPVHHPTTPHQKNWQTLFSYHHPVAKPHPIHNLPTGETSELLERVNRDRNAVSNDCEIFSHDIRRFKENTDLVRGMLKPKLNGEQVFFNLDMTDCETNNPGYLEIEHDRIEQDIRRQVEAEFRQRYGIGPSH